MNGLQVGRTLFLEGVWPIGLHKVALKAPKLPSQDDYIPKKNRHSESVLLFSVWRRLRTQNPCLFYSRFYHRLQSESESG